LKILFSYSIRNLLRRKWRTFMTLVGIALTVFASILMLALARGIQQRIDATGKPENFLFISRKGQNVMFSSVSDEELVHLWSLPNGKVGLDDDLLVSPEIMHVSHVQVEGEDKTTHAPISVRGVQPIAFDVHDNVKVIDGNLPEEEYDILVGKTAYVKLGVSKETLDVGNTLSFENNEWTICGIFEAGASIYESELWVGEETLQTVLRRQTHTFAVMKFDSSDDAKNVQTFLNKSGVIDRYFKGWTEKEYYEEFGRSLSWILWLSLFMVVSIIIAGTLIGINTMYTVIINRMQELATLRVLGYRRREVFLSLMVESVLISLLGGILGCTLGVFLNDLPLKVANSAFFFIVDYQVVGVGIGLSLIIGVVGVFLPVLKGFRTRIIDALRGG